MKEIARRFLRGAGVTLIALGGVHLVATPHIPQLLDGMSAESYQLAVGPTLLNHVLVGILLLPMGYTTWLAAAREHVEQSWARRVLLINALGTACLPISIVIFMRQPQYYTAPMFLIGVGAVSLVCALMVAAAASSAFRSPREVK